MSILYNRTGYHLRCFALFDALVSDSGTEDEFSRTAILDDSRKGTMDLAELYHFLFETYAGIGCLVGAGIVISIIAAVISERKTRKVYRDRGEKPRDDQDE